MARHHEPNAVFPEDGLPARETRILRLMCLTGAPRAFIEAYPHEVERAASAHDFDAERYRATDPLLKTWQAIPGWSALDSGDLS